MLARILAPFRDERGNSVIEYALILSLIAIICLGGVTILGSNTKNQLASAVTSITGSTPSDTGGGDRNGNGGGNGNKSH